MAEDENVEYHPNTRATMDYILLHHCGGIGKWQWKKALFAVILFYSASYPLFITVFTTYAPNHRCFVEYCDATTNDTIEASWISLAIPKQDSSSSSSNFLGQKRAYDSCHMYHRIEGNEECLDTSFRRDNVSDCIQYIYDDYYFDETLATKYDLVCDFEYKTQLLNSLLMLGLLIGSFIGGRLGDKFGRKNTMFWANLIIVPCILLSAFVPNFGAYAFLRWITCVCIAITWVNSTVYMLELFVPQGRKYVFLLQDLPVYTFVLALVTYVSRDWTTIHYGIAIFCSTFIPTWFFLPESPRWLAQNKKHEEAFEILMDMAKTNGKKLSVVDKDEVRAILLQIAIETQTIEGEKNLNSLDLFRSGHAKKSIILCFAWMTACISYYALTLNSTQLSGHIIANFAFNGLVELPIPFLLLVTLNRFGRRPLLFLGHFSLGLSCLCLAIIPRDRPNLILGFWLFGKAASVVAFSMVFLVTSELYPTNLRSQAVGTCSFISRIVCLLAPFIAPLARLWQPLPLLVLGVPAIISGCLNIKLPETKELNLPQTMEEAQKIEELEMKDLDIEKIEEDAVNGEEISSL